MDLSFSVNLMGNLGIMFAMIILGYIAKPKRESLEDIAKLVVDYGIPALIFSAFVLEFNSDMLLSMSTVLLFAVGSALVGYGVSFLVIKAGKIDKEMKPEFLLASVYGNTGFIGIPVCLAVFGREGALLAAVFDFGMTFVVFSLGLFVLLGSKRGSIHEAFRNLINPPIIAFIVGLIFASTNIPIPSLVMTGINMLGAMAPPLAMLFVGGMLSQVGKMQYQVKAMTSLVLTRLILIPLVMVVFIKLFGVAGVVAGVILLETATPTMVAAPLLYQRYIGNAVFSTSAVFITTMLCIVTIPLIMLLI
ncbi:AEC family transporter [Desulfitibacter alkalitolerans]|uniref:AEC family transporter n=1 Tax=Desulfitibacter alkalitolerans TaxID=264641 RepID=UPI000485D27A|nr:AEC family transporter [Desulfitibacter alkalitolerans]